MMHCEVVGEFDSKSYCTSSPKPGKQTDQDVLEEKVSY